MTTEIYLPRLGSTTMEAATVIEWLVAEGDLVEHDQPLVEVETDKTNVEVPSPGAGVLLRIVAPAGVAVAVGGTMGWIGEPGETVPDPPRDAPDGSATGEPALPGDADPTTPVATSIAPHAAVAPALRASPAARRRARELGVDLSVVSGTGAGGRISSTDIEAEAGASANVTDAGAAGGAGDGAPLTSIRRRIAERMTTASSETAPVTLTRQIDATALVTARAADRADQGGGPGVLDRIIAASARALMRHPDLNARFVESRVHRSATVSIGFAVQASAGLIVPVIREVDPDDLDDIARRRRSLTGRVLNGSVRPDEVFGGTFTVSNLGGHGIDSFTPIINLPEVAILGVGRIHDAAMAARGAVVVRPAMNLCLTFDHRVIDGAPAASFLSEVAELLERGA